MSMTTRRLVGNDYSFGQGRANLATGLEAVLQRCKTHLMQFRGEWFLNAPDGTPWFDVSGQTVNQPLLERIVRDRLLTVDDVTAVNEMVVLFDAVSRKVSVLCQVVTVFGTANLSEIINILS